MLLKYRTKPQQKSNISFTDQIQVSFSIVHTPRLRSYVCHADWILLHDKVHTVSHPMNTRKRAKSLSYDQKHDQFRESDVIGNLFQIQSKVFLFVVSWIEILPTH